MVSIRSRVSGVSGTCSDR
ncbi:hypothetical protein YPPY29_1425, partial [Yersinia pestis PY-29]